MTPLRLRLRKSEFDAVKFGKKTEVVLPVTNKRIHYLCFARMTKDCNEKQSACRKCFEVARPCDGYMCYPFDVAIIRRGKTDKYITRQLTNIFFEERDGKLTITNLSQHGDELPNDMWENINVAIANAVEKVD